MESIIKGLTTYLEEPKEKNIAQRQKSKFKDF